MHPTKSIYAFGLNRARPGYFNLSFLANKNAPIQTWVSNLTLPALFRSDPSY